MISREGGYEIDTTSYDHEDDVVYLETLTPEELAKRELEQAANKSLSQVGEAAMEVAKLQAQLKLAKKKLREAEKTYCKAVEALNKPPAAEKTSKRKGKSQTPPQVEEVEQPTPPAPTAAKPKLIDRSQLPPPPPWQELTVVELDMGEEMETPFFEAGMESLGQIKQEIDKGYRSFAKKFGIDMGDAKDIGETLNKWLCENYPAEFPTASNKKSSTNS